MTLVARRAPRDADDLRVGTVRQLMSPTQQIRKGPLFQETTSRRVLVGAWLQVRSRVLASKDARTRGAAEAFGNQLDKSIRDIQRELRSQTFSFEPQKGVLKRNKIAAGAPPKLPRPIVVSPVRSRVVQRAILDTCQTGQPRIRKRLGQLPIIIATPTSVGGLPGRGVPEAMAQISEIIARGAKWFVRSDLKKFFQTIPKPRIEEFLRTNVADGQFVDLFMRALATELENEADVRELLHLFPIGDVGVPQGSALSALCANIVLQEFDADLNGRGLHTIRYLDDFVIFGPTKTAAMKGWGRAQEILTALGMECHDPAAGTGKAAMGEIANGFEFLSFYVDDKDIYPTSNVQAEFLKDLRDTIREAKTVIGGATDEPRRAEPRFVQSMALLDRKIRGWGDAFSATTKHLVFAQLDTKIDRMIADYRGWFGRIHHGRSPSHQRRLMGIALLGDTSRSAVDKTIRS